MNRLTPDTAMVIIFNFIMSNGFAVIAINLSSIGKNENRMKNLIGLTSNFESNWWINQSTSVGSILGMARRYFLIDVLGQNFSSNASSIWVQWDSCFLLFHFFSSFINNSTYYNASHVRTYLGSSLCCPWPTWNGRFWFLNVKKWYRTAL